MNWLTRLTVLITGRRRTNEPARWALFGAGGEFAAVLLPGLILVLGLAVPLAIGTDAESSHENLIGLLTNPLLSLIACGLLALILWHCAHRVVHLLHDLMIHPSRLVLWAVYGFAVAVPAAAWVVIVALT